MQKLEPPKVNGVFEKKSPLECTPTLLVGFCNYKKFEEKILFDTHVCIMHYALNHIQKYLVIHYIIYHLSF